MIRMCDRGKLFIIVLFTPRCASVLFVFWFGGHYQFLLYVGLMGVTVGQDSDYLNHIHYISVISLSLVIGLSI